MQPGQVELPEAKIMDVPTTCPCAQEETHTMLQRKTIRHTWVGYIVVLMSVCDRNRLLAISNPSCTDARESRAQHTRCGSRRLTAGGWERYAFQSLCVSVLARPILKVPRFSSCSNKAQSF